MKSAEKKQLNKQKFAELKVKALKDLNKKRSPRKIEAKAWSEEFIEGILDQIAEGKALKHICKENNVAFRWFYKKMNESEKWTNKYREAQEIADEESVEEAKRIANEVPREIFDAQGNKIYDKSEIEWKKMRIDVIKWQDAIKRATRKESNSSPTQINIYQIASEKIDQNLQRIIDVTPKKIEANKIEELV